MEGRAWASIFLLPGITGGVIGIITAAAVIMEEVVITMAAAIIQGEAATTADRMAVSASSGVPVKG